MKFIFISILSLFTINAVGQEKVSLEELQSNVGVFVEVKGKISSISKVGKGKKYQAIIYVGGNSPNEKLSILVKNVLEEKSDYILKDEKYLRAMVYVKGIVKLHKGKPQIEINSADELMFGIDVEVPISEIPVINTKNGG